MTTEFNCDRGDYSNGVNLIHELDITTDKGISVKKLKAAELSEFRSIWRIHVHTHPGHTATASFSIPDGYEERDGVIYKAK